MAQLDSTGQLKGQTAVVTGTARAQWDSYGAGGQRTLLERIATRRTGQPYDIARGVLFFAAPDAGWVSGQTISIDGGHSLF